MEPKELEPTEFSVDKAHATKQTLFGGALVVTCVVGIAMSWDTADRWLGILPPWVVFGAAAPFMIAVTLRWIRLLISSEPLLRLEPDGAWTPTSGTIAWKRIKDVRCGNGAVHLVLAKPGLAPSDEASAGRKLILWQHRDATVVPIPVGNAAHDVAELIRHHSGLPAQSTRPSIAAAPMRIRLVYAFIVATLVTTAETALEGVSGPVIWLTGALLFFVLEWLTWS